MSYQDIVAEIALNDERFMVLTAENRALIRNLPAILKERFIDTGITEQTMIGAAAGLALRGRIPIVHALAAFLTLRAFEFIRTDIGIGGLNVKLIGFIPGFLSDGNGPTHQAIEDVSIMRGIPGLEVFCPADEDDFLTALPIILKSASPSYIRANTLRGNFQHNKKFKIGEAEVISKGEDVTILVYGMLFKEALIAKEILTIQGLKVGLINMRSLKPVDEQVILETAETSDLIITLEDHFLTGGLYSIVAEVLLKNRTTAHVHPLALDNRWFRPAKLNEVLEFEGFTGQQIAQRITTAITQTLLLNN